MCVTRYVQEYTSAAPDLKKQTNKNPKNQTTNFCITDCFSSICYLKCSRQEKWGGVWGVCEVLWALSFHYSLNRLEFFISN